MRGACAIGLVGAAPGDFKFSAWLIGEPNDPSDRSCEEKSRTPIISGNRMALGWVGVCCGWDGGETAASCPSGEGECGGDTVSADTLGGWLVAVGAFAPGDSAEKKGDMGENGWMRSLGVVAPRYSSFQ